VQGPQHQRLLPAVAAYQLAHRQRHSVGLRPAALPAPPDDWICGRMDTSLSPSQAALLACKHRPGKSWDKSVEFWACKRFRQKVKAVATAALP